MESSSDKREKTLNTVITKLSNHSVTENVPALKGLADDFRGTLFVLVGGGHVAVHLAANIQQGQNADPLGVPGVPPAHTQR